MSARPKVPAVPNRRPADVLFQGPAEPAPPEAPVNVKISVYLPGPLLAALDSYRAGLLSEHSVRVDRSRILRELVRELPELPQLIARLREDERS